MIQNTERLVSIGQLTDSYINSNGAIVNPGIQSFIVVQYEVTPGDELVIHETLHTGSSYSYAFYNSSTFSSSTKVLVGPAVTASQDDMEVTVPAGATHLGVQKFNSEEYVERKVDIAFKDINKLTQKVTIAGTEKLPVSDTEYITPTQIVSKNLVTSISLSSTDSEYPSAKCVYDIVGDIETLLSQI